MESEEGEEGGEGVGILVAGLDCAKFGFYQFPIFLFIVVMVISILVKTTV